MQIRTRHELNKRKSVASPILKNVHFQSQLSDKWKQNGIFIMAKVFKFITKMTSLIQSFQFRNLSNQNFKALNDKSSYYRFYLNSRYINQQLSIMEKIRYWFNANIYLNKIKTSYRNTLFSKVINPNNSFYVIFQVILLIILIFNVCYIPVSVCFDVQDNLTLETLLIAVPNYVTLFAVILNFNTAYYDYGILITSRKQIGKNYLKNSFLQDGISLIPMIVNANPGSILQFFVLFRVSMIVKLNLQFEDNFNLRKNYGTFIDVVKLMSIFLFSSHMFACIFFYIAMSEIKNGATNTWIQMVEIQDTNWMNQYINAMYWGSVTTLTIGYGDIYPTTEMEKAYVILVALMSSIVFGFTIANIGEIFNQINKKKIKQRDKMSIITSFIQKRGLNKQLEIKVKKYFEYYFQIEENRDQECEQLIQQLSDDLRDDVKIDFYKKYLINQPLIKSTFSDEFINKACLLMQEKLLIPDEILLFKHEEIHDLYFIIEGQLDLIIDYKSDRRSIIRTLKTQQSVAETYFFTQQKLPYSIKSTKFSRIVHLNRKLFEDLLKDYPADWERFKQLQSLILLNECQQLQCDVCLQSHKLEDCRVLFYQPFSARIIKKVNQNKQERDIFLRPNRTRFKSFLDKLIIQEGVLSLAIDESFITKEQISEEFVIRADLLRLRQAELAQEFRGRQMALLSPEEQEKFIQRRNGVKNSMKIVQESVDSQELIRSYRQSQQIEEGFTDVKIQLYQEYLGIIKQDTMVNLDRYKEFEHFKKDQNIMTILQRIKEDVKVKQGTHKRQRRLIKKLTWIDSMSPRKR